MHCGPRLHPVVGPLGTSRFPLQIFMAQPGQAPGRPDSETGSAPPAATGEAAPDPGAPGAAPPPRGGGGAFDGMGMMLLLPLLLFGLLFLMNRSDKKRRSQLESGLKKGDRVLTRAGFIGKLVEVGDQTVKVELAPGVNVTMVKNSIEGLADDPNKPKDPKLEAKKDEAKKDEPKKDEPKKEEPKKDEGKKGDKKK
jgi:preprotein translocase subunit YajC